MFYLRVVINEGVPLLEILTQPTTAVWSTPKLSTGISLPDFSIAAIASLSVILVGVNRVLITF